jgi:hypothetical protein
MNDSETAEFLCGLEGTDITLDPPSELPLHLPRQTWVIDKKLSERSQPMTQQDVTDSLGLPFAAAKFLCHRKENPSKKAFMRIYLQIPVIGTQYLSPQVRGKQATGPQQHVELTALKALKQLECDVASLLIKKESKARMISFREVIQLMRSGIKSPERGTILGARSSVTPDRFCEAFP